MSAALSPAKVSKLQRAERELTPQQRKILDAVPIQEAWEPHMILGEVRRLGFGTAPNVVQATLVALASDGLVREDTAGRWSRVVARADAAPAPAPAAPAAAPLQPAKPDTLARLGDLSARLRGQAAVLQDLADEIDDVAIEVEERIAEAGRGGEKLKQLRALLGSI